MKDNSRWISQSRLFNWYILYFYFLIRFWTCFLVSVMNRKLIYKQSSISVVEAGTRTKAGPNGPRNFLLKNSSKRWVFLILCRSIFFVLECEQWCFWIYWKDLTEMLMFVRFSKLICNENWIRNHLFEMRSSILNRLDKKTV